MFFFCFFVVLVFVVHVSKINWRGERVGGVWLIRVFFGFFDFF